MKFGKEALLRVHAAKMAKSWAHAFDLSEDEALEHLINGLGVAWFTMELSRNASMSGAMRRESAIQATVRML